jgi:dTDP-4-amino-4,6-dideoxygalactose transaminase
MKRLRWNLSRRRKLGQIYAKELSNSNPNFSICNIQNNCSPSWIQFPILVNDKSAFYKYMQQKGVDLSWTYRYSCAVSYEEEGFPNAERAAKTVLGLPTYPSLTDEQAYMICEIAKKYPYK